MPQRFLRPGITDSKRYNALSWPAQSLYTRLITLVDDFGRYEADPRIVRGHAFALLVDSLSNQDVAGWLNELASNEMLFIYEVDGKEFLQLLRWKEKARSASKCPQPPAVVQRPATSCTPVQTIVSNCDQLQTIENKCLSPSSSPSPSPTSTSSPSGGGGEDPASLAPPARGKVEPALVVEALHSAWLRKTGLKANSMTYNREWLAFIDKGHTQEELELVIDHIQWVNREREPRYRISLAIGRLLEGDVSFSDRLIEATAWKAPPKRTAGASGESSSGWSKEQQKAILAAHVARHEQEESAAAAARASAP